MSLIADKLKDYEHNKPIVELYEEIVFQNEIFKNRISELEENMVFNKDFVLDEEIELERIKREQDKR